MKRSETLTLDTVQNWFNSFLSLTAYCFVDIFIIHLQSIPKSPNLSFRIFPHFLLLVLGQTICTAPL